MKEEEIQEIIQNYNIGTLKKFENLTGGCVNLVIKVETTNGIFVLKIYENYWQTKFQLEKIAKSLYDLKTKTNFPVAKPIKTKYGNFLLKQNKKLFEISEFVKGETYDSDFNEMKIVNAAKVLAQLHKETEIKSKKNIKLNCFNLAYDSLWISKKFKREMKLSLLDKISEKKQITNYDKMILDIYIPFIREQTKLLKENLKYVRKRQNLSQIHNDYHGGQIIFDGNDIAAIIDFESMIEDSSNYDLVKAVQYFSNHVPNKKSEFDFDRLKLFLDSYKEVFGKIDIESHEVLAYLRHALLWQLNFFINKLFETQDEKIIKEKNIKFIMNKLKWVTNNEKKFCDFFVDNN